MSRLFDEISAHLAERQATLAERQRFGRAMAHAHWEVELWEAIAPFLRSPAEQRAAAAFMAAMLRERARD